MPYAGPEAQARYIARLRQDPVKYAAHLARRNEIRKKWQAANKHKHNAHNAVYKAIKRGDLVRPDACQGCGKAGKPEASHDDYSKPLEVEWLCRVCHARKDAH